MLLSVVCWDEISFIVSNFMYRGVTCQFTKNIHAYYNFRPAWEVCGTIGSQIPHSFLSLCVCVCERPKYNNISCAKYRIRFIRSLWVGFFSIHLYYWILFCSIPLICVPKLSGFLWQLAIISLVLFHHFLFNFTFLIKWNGKKNVSFHLFFNLMQCLVVADAFACTLCPKKPNVLFYLLEIFNIIMLFKENIYSEHYTRIKNEKCMSFSVREKRSEWWIELKAD